MRVLIFLIIVLAVAAIALAVYAFRLKRVIRESTNPYFALSRKQRRALAQDHFKREGNKRDLEWQDRLNETIGLGNPLGHNREDRK
ncbi:MAG: hypothetical protein UY35_C0029G0007 [Candidatus Saccharibacteria bacterium GW2011_GWC2_48_9]|nr:MAG: hypothetical protein UY35_C0029G0007 [Candidatus Saccharibacteria bacterium GW2011_GWC2_48_9]HCH34973.1 hypothetical protein [Candidatus Saccharibacteria bacterium]